MASVRINALPAKRKEKWTEKISIYLESIALSLDREKANRIHQARKEAREGKTIPLRCIK